MYITSKKWTVRLGSLLGLYESFPIPRPVHSFKIIWVCMTWPNHRKCANQKGLVTTKGKGATLIQQKTWFFKISNVNIAAPIEIATPVTTHPTPLCRRCPPLRLWCSSGGRGEEGAEGRRGGSSLEVSPIKETSLLKWGNIEYLRWCIFMPITFSAVFPLGFLGRNLVLTSWI